MMESTKKNKNNFRVDSLIKWLVDNKLKINSIRKGSIEFHFAGIGAPKVKVVENETIRIDTK